MPKLVHLTVAAAALLAAGCGANAADAGEAPALPTPSTAAAAPTTTTPSDPALNERGMIPKALGQEAGLGGTGKPSAVTFAIDAVAVDPPCTEYGSKPDSGHTLLLDVRVATGTDAEVASYLSGLLNPFAFSEIGKDGVTRTAQAGSCTDYTKSLPSQFGVNQKYAGTIEIVVPEASGTLVLQDQLDNTGGWEWTY